MNPAPTMGSPQAAIERYLLPREVCVAKTRRHPAVLIVPSAQAVAGLLATALLSVTVLRGHSLLIYIAWILWGLLLARLAWKTINWSVDYFVITSARILLTSGIFTRSVNMMPLTKVTDMSFHRSVAGRLLGYGEFRVESAGQDQALGIIDHVPYPEQLYSTVCEWIFKKALDESGVPPEPAAPASEPAEPAEPAPESTTEFEVHEEYGETVDHDINEGSDQPSPR
jgi:uncharacterized membrane protein YdbT with pleckstrin-like domain